MALALLPFAPVKIWTASRYTYGAVAFFAPLAAIAGYSLFERVRGVHRLVRVPATALGLAFIATLTVLYAWQTSAQDSASGRRTERWALLVNELRRNYANVPPGTTIYIVDGPWTNPMEQYVGALGRARRVRRRRGVRPTIGLVQSARRHGPRSPCGGPSTACSRSAQQVVSPRGPIHASSRADATWTHRPFFPRALRSEPPRPGEQSTPQVVHAYCTMPSCGSSCLPIPCVERQDAMVSRLKRICTVDAADQKRSAAAGAAHAVPATQPSFVSHDCGGTASRRRSETTAWRGMDDCRVPAPAARRPPQLDRSSPRRSPMATGCARPPSARRRHAWSRPPSRRRLRRTRSRTPSSSSMPPPPG
jgi:hypothetical protein